MGWPWHEETGKGGPMTPEFLSALAFPWLVVAGYTASISEKHGWGVWKWFAASLLTGPVSWLLLYLKLRDKRERAGPGRRRRELEASRSRGRRIS